MTVRFGSSGTSAGGSLDRNGGALASAPARAATLLDVAARTTTTRTTLAGLSARLEHDLTT